MNFSIYGVHFLQEMRLAANICVCKLLINVEEYIEICSRKYFEILSSDSTLIYFLHSCLSD